MLAGIECADYLPAMIVIVAGNGNDSDVRVIDQILRAGVAPGFRKTPRHLLGLGRVHVAEGNDTALRMACKGSRVLLAHAKPDHAYAKQSARHAEPLRVATAEQRS